MPAIAYSPNGKKLAIATADRHVILLDEKFHKRDKFSTKPVDSKVVCLRLDLFAFHE